MHGFIASGTMGVPCIDVGRKGKVSYDGSVIIHRSPEGFTHDDKRLEMAFNTIEDGAICAFYEDGEGDIQIDHVYLQDTLECNNLAKNGVSYFCTPKGSDKQIDMVDALSSGGKCGVWLVDKILEDMTVVLGTLNQGSGRFYRSKRLKSAYQKARAARFEHGEQG